MIDRLLQAYALKGLPREGWRRRGHPHPESVAAHSWGVGLLVLWLLPEELDRERALTYAVVHDLPEAKTGDLIPADGVSAREKARREHSAMRELAPDLLPIWEAYEAQADPEARFVRQLDRLDMALQALVYRDRLDASEFITSAARVIEDPRLLEVFDAVRAKLQG